MHTPTQQQIDIINGALAGPPAVVVTAGAGTGKTTALTWLAERFADHGVGGVYLALNKDVAAEVGCRFLRGNVQAMTVHSLAYQIAKTIPHISVLLDRLNSENAVPRWKLARHMRFAEVFAYTSFSDRNMSQVAGLLPRSSTVIGSNRLLIHGLDTIRNWCFSADPLIGVSHVDCPTQMPGEVFHSLFAPKVAQIAQWLWDTDLTNPQGRIAFSHDHYLKMVSLAHPDLTKIWPRGSLLFLDEAQDARPAMLSIISDQLERMRIICVGDSNQAIYRFTGAVDALPTISAIPGAVTLPLTQSFRFGPAISELANSILELLGTNLRLEGAATVSSTVNAYQADAVPPKADTVLVRTNARLIEEVGFEQARGHKVHAVADLNYITWIMEDIGRICTGDRARHKSLKHIVGETALRQFCDPEAGEAGDLGPLLRLGLNIGPSEVISALESCVPEELADVVVSTMHKAKGREWEKVRLAVDAQDVIPGISSRIPTADTAGQLTPEARDALMLFYVSVTRAIGELHIPSKVLASLTDFQRSRSHQPLRVQTA